jgi:hypothetical protein
MKKKRKMTFWLPVIFSSVPVVLLLAILVAYFSSMVGLGQMMLMFIPPVFLITFPFTFYISLRFSIRHMRDNVQAGKSHRFFPLISTLIIQGIELVWLVRNASIFIYYLPFIPHFLFELFFR